jgi:hypothetical protein
MCELLLQNQNCKRFFVFKFEPYLQHLKKNQTYVFQNKNRFLALFLKYICKIKKFIVKNVIKSLIISDFYYNIT